MMRFVARHGQHRAKGRILISMVQVIGGMGVVYSIPFPNLFQQAVDSIGAYIDLELPRLIPIRCLYPINSIHELMLKTGLSLTVVGLLCLIALSNYARHSREEREQAESNDGSEPAEKAVSEGSADDGNERSGGGAQGAAKWRRASLGARMRAGAAPQRMAARRARGGLDGPVVGLAKLWGDACSTVAFYLVYLVYPSISAGVFQFFVCDQMDGDGEDGLRYLRVDLAVDCDGGLWWRSYVAVMIIFDRRAAQCVVLIGRHYSTLDRLRRYEIKPRSSWCRFEAAHCRSTSIRGRSRDCSARDHG